MNIIDKILLLGSPDQLGYRDIFEYVAQIHIVLGIIAVTTGTLILALTKGNRNHKRIGKIFVGAMMGTAILAVPFGVGSNFYNGDEANILTAFGGWVVAALTFTSYRMFETGAGNVAWYDKAMLGFTIFTAILFGYLTLLMVVGTDLFGLTVRTTSNEQFTLLANTYPLLERDVVLLSTTGGNIFGMIEIKII